MATPITAIHILRLLLQAEQNLSGLQRDMRRNAETWKAAAQAQSLPVGTLAANMNDAATAYQTRLQWLSNAQANTTLWSRLGAMWAALGGTDADFSGLVTPLQAVATQLGPAAKASYAQVIGICNQILAAVDAPPNLWPE